ncbi:MAG: Asp-tRNA(Asn)/Glu-tRNA(Gln) amidotransferase subunit GatB [Candidatus Margulisiibacteriota bacterium]|nr:Asp-tRNA(Asn)/Glu-tRNA(Gln) amidotransferase subunit GatB [Candidatus Margulisiibacteriota bacterium]
MSYELIIGLEIHAQLNTNSKLFCTAATDFGDSPNTNVSPVSLGLPGALPVLNKDAVNMAIMAGLALDCNIQERSVFARKNYFYADLPKGYQISQFEYPICLGGKVHLDEFDKTINVTRIHMEEDAGKLNHQGADGIAGATSSISDLNRAGVPLIEIVSEPEIRSAKEARAYMEKVHQILSFIGVCDGDLEKGSFRCDANISVRPVGQVEFGTRTEVKNLNSFRSLERAINFEMKRQIKVVESGGKIIQQTMNFDDVTGETSALRSKENAHDYRYFPDPDLKPLLVTPDQINHIKNTMCELPDKVRSRFSNDLGLPDHDIKVYLQTKFLFEFFESARTKLKTASAKDMSKWVVGELNALLKTGGVFLNQLSQDDFAKLIDQCASGDVSTKMVKDILPLLLKGDELAAALHSMGGVQISNQDELQSIVDRVLSENPDVVEKIKNGKTGSANFLMGQVMKETKGRAKPDTVRDLILNACQS